MLQSVRRRIVTLQGFAGMQFIYLSGQVQCPRCLEGVFLTCSGTHGGVGRVALRKAWVSGILPLSLVRCAK